MKFGMVNKSTILKRFVLHTLQRNIAHLAVITRKTNIKLGILKGGNWKRAKFGKLFERCHNLMKLGMVSNLSVVNGFDLHVLPCITTHLSHTQQENWKFLT